MSESKLKTQGQTAEELCAECEYRKQGGDRAKCLFCPYNKHRNDVCDDHLFHSRLPWR